MAPEVEGEEANNISKLLLIDYKKMRENHNTRWKKMLKEAQQRVDAGESESVLDEVEDQIEKEAKKIHMQTAVMNREVLEKIWGDYDNDSSGTLDKKEVNGLMKDYFNSAFRYFVLVVKDRCLKKLKGSNSQYGISMGTETGEKIEKIILNSSKKNVRIWLGELNQKNQIEKIYVQLDADGSGHLDKDEFLTGFMKVVKERCGEKQVKLLQDYVMKDTEGALLKVYNSVVASKNRS